MNGICCYLGHQSLIDLCEGSNPYVSVPAAMVGTLLIGYGVAKGCGGYAQPKITSSNGQSPLVRSLENRGSLIKKNGSLPDVAIFEELHSFFVNARNADQSETKQVFRKAWKEKFNSLPKDAQDEIIRADIKRMGHEGNEDERIRNLSFDFVRDLNTSDAYPEGDSYQLLKDHQLADLLQRIISDIQEQIKAEKASS